MIFFGNPRIISVFLIFFTYCKNSLKFNELLWSGPLRFFDLVTWTSIIQAFL